MRKYLMGFAAIGMVGWMGSSRTQAAFVGLTSPGDEDGSSHITVAAHSGEAGSREIIHSIDGTGMNPGGVNPNMDVGGNPTDPASQMALFRNTSGQHGGTVTGSHWGKYQFDQNYQISNVWIWNWNEPAFPSFGWRNITIQTSLTGGTSPADWTTVYTGVVPISDGANPSAVDLVAPVSGGSILAKYVMLTNTGTSATNDDNNAANWENWSSDPSDSVGPYTNDAGLSEVRFEIIPEPASIGMLMAAAPFLVRRRS